MIALGIDSLLNRRMPANNVTSSGPIQPHSRSSGIGVISRARRDASRSAAPPPAVGTASSSPTSPGVGANITVSPPSAVLRLASGPSSGSFAGWPACVAVIERNAMWRDARVGTRIVTDRVPGEARADNGGAGVLTLAGAPIGQPEGAPARLAEALASA